ncbi:MAG TPA: DnaJ C-terminal domain-containing protein [Ktedonobacteraceae bacterium]|nr:DnaJ C-terminal domain-containing protein [Ktedonobacteraceae bacterium]
MAIEGSQTGDIRATLAISQAEARTGSSRTLNLPGGRRITVPVRAGIRDGEEIRLRGQGDVARYGGPPGDLILTVSIASVEQFSSQSYYPAGQNNPTEFIPASPASNSYPGYPNSQVGPTVASSPQYAFPTSQSNYPNSATPGQVSGQQPLFLNQTEAPSGNQVPYSGYHQGGTQAAPPSVPPQRKRRGNASAITLLIVVLVLLLIGGSLAIFYTQVYTPQMHAQATATSQTQVAETSQAQITGTAQANGQATANAIGTSQAIAGATATAAASATVAASATAAALQSFYTQVTSSTPALSDPLNAQDGNNWDAFPTNSSGGSCGFSGGAYHSSITTKGFFQPCYAQASNFSNFALQVQMVITQGDQGGVVFRANNASSIFYLFRISQNGAYDLYVYVDSQGSHASRLLSGSSGIILTGNQANTITVIADGSNLYFYINQQYIDGTTDTHFSSGQIGFFGESDTNPTDVAFSNLKVWTIAS